MFIVVVVILLIFIFILLKIIVGVESLFVVKICMVREICESLLFEVILVRGWVFCFKLLCKLNLIKFVLFGVSFFILCWILI